MAMEEEAFSDAESVADVNINTIRRGRGQRQEPRSLSSLGQRESYQDDVGKGYA